MPALAAWGRCRKDGETEVHYYGSGETCQCGEHPTVAAVSVAGHAVTGLRVIEGGTEDAE